MTTRPASTTSTSSPLFAAPTRIPDRVAMVADAAPLPSFTTEGVPYSTGALNAAIGVIGDIIRTANPPPPAPPAKVDILAPSKPIAVSRGVQSAKLIRKVIPAYPTLARAARITGTVRLIGIIGKEGTIQNLQLISGPPLLVDAAFQAVRQWIYQPTLLSGKPVEVVAPIDVIFTLGQ